MQHTIRLLCNLALYYQNRPGRLGSGRTVGDGLDGGPGSYGGMSWYAASRSPPARQMMVSRGIFADGLEILFITIILIILYFV